MRPAFSSTRQAAAFALLLLGLLLASTLGGKKFLPPRREIYSSIWWPNGDFPYMDEQFFQEKGDIDIVFIGSSHIWGAFNNPSIQEQLSKQTGHSVCVRTFGWGGPAYDETYFVAKDLLESRQVRMLVVDDGCNEADEPHPLASKMFRFGDDAKALDGLSFSYKATYYFASIAGMPRNLLSLIRSDLPADLNTTNYWQARSHAKNFADMQGSFAAQIGFRDNPDAVPEPFTNFAPKMTVRPSDVCIYSEATKTNFSFSNLPPMQLHFAQKIAALAEEHGCKLVIIHIPTFEERHYNVISGPAFWPDAVHTNITVLGIPPAILFKGLTDEDIRKLYSDSVHFNENGQNYFTTVMTPNLLKIYESPTVP